MADLIDSVSRIWHSQDRVCHEYLIKAGEVQPHCLVSPEIAKSWFG